MLHAGRRGRGRASASLRKQQAVAKRSGALRLARLTRSSFKDEQKAALIHAVPSLELYLRDEPLASSQFSVLVSWNTEASLQVPLLVSCPAKKGGSWPTVATSPDMSVRQPPQFGMVICWWVPGPFTSLMFLIWHCRPYLSGSITLAVRAAVLTPRPVKSQRRRPCLQSTINRNVVQPMLVRHLLEPTRIGAYPFP